MTTASRRYGARRILAIAVTGALVFASGGCLSRDKDGTASDNSIRVPRLSAGQHYVVNPFTQQLMAYDMQTMKPASVSNEANYLYYGFGSISGTYTSGNSGAGGFTVVEITPSSVKTVLTVDDDEAIFPIARDTEAVVFLLYTYDSELVETARQLVLMTSRGTLEPFTRVTGLVSYGAIVGDVLYYTTADERGDSYDLWSIPKQELDAIPRSEEVGLSGGELYAYHGELFTSDGTNILAGEREYRCSGGCWFLEDYGVLVRIAPNSLAGLQLDVIDVDSGEVVHQVPDALGFELDDGVLTTFCVGAVDRYQL